MLARKAVPKLWDKIGQMNIELGCCIEARNDAEMPEQVLGCALLREPRMFETGAGGCGSRGGGEGVNSQLGGRGKNLVNPTIRYILKDNYKRPGPAGARLIQSSAVAAEGHNAPSSKEEQKQRSSVHLVRLSASASVRVCASACVRARSP